MDLEEVILSLKSVYPNLDEQDWDTIRRIVEAMSPGNSSTSVSRHNLTQWIDKQLALKTGIALGAVLNIWNVSLAKRFKGVAYEYLTNKGRIAVQTIVDSEPVPNNLPGEAFKKSLEEWNNQITSLKIAIAVYNIKQRGKILAPKGERNGLNVKAMQFVKSRTNNPLAVQTFMAIFDYWAKDRNDWESVFKDALIQEALGLFQEFLTNEFGSD